MNKFLLFFLLLLHPSAHATEGAEANTRKIREALHQYHGLHLDHLVQNADNVIGVEILVAKGFEERAYSQFGHSLIRFVDNDGLWSNDITVSFVAEIVDPNLSTIKTYVDGIVGNFPSVAEIKTLHEFWQEYVKNEKREILRYVLPLEKFDIKNLIATLAHWHKNPEAMGDYTFFSNNCAHLLAKFLVESGLSYETRIPRKPFSIPKWLERGLMNPYPSLLVLNQRSVIRKLEQALRTNEEDLSRGVWPENSYEILRAGFEEKEVKFIYDHFVQMPLALSKKIAADMHYSKTAVNYSAVMSMDNLDPRLYQLCASDTCIEERVQVAKTTWARDVLLEKQDRLQFILNNYSVEGASRDEFPPFKGEYRGRPFNLVRVKSLIVEEFFRKFTRRLRY